ncbi:CsbD family protein [Paracoccus sp. 11-3]|uniref:CsbD family protein n=1 Tax=Paracoccus amoyensis TaxID=2760093 RepID=A0A926JEE2_9RHOB|nr:CsbD family protein [Paracoccus amoyensis]MBC9248123.1 CsbD family protein [Paracoccus amoyensis]
MNWDVIQGKWKQVKGSVKEKWGELTDDELDQIDGNRDRLAGKLQEKYGWAKNDAEREIDDYFRDKT